MDELITCTKCKTPQPRDQFFPDKKKRNGLSSWCRGCYAAKDVARRINHPDKILAYKRSDHAKTVRVAWYQDNKERLAPKGRAATAAWRARNLLAVQAKAAADYQANKVAHDARTVAWAKAHPDRIAAHQRTRRAQRHAAGRNDFTPEQWTELQERQDHRCAYCGKRAKGRLTQDHITPLSKGGSHTLSNIVAVCKSCNSKKNAGPVPKPVQPLLLTVAPAKPPKKRSA